jgi:hypothetical protein
MPPPTIAPMPTSANRSACPGMSLPSVLSIKPMRGNIADNGFYFLHAFKPPRSFSTRTFLMQAVAVETLQHLFQAFDSRFLCLRVFCFCFNIRYTPIASTYSCFGKGLLSVLQGVGDLDVEAGRGVLAVGCDVGLRVGVDIACSRQALAYVCVCVFPKHACSRQAVAHV